MIDFLTRIDTELFLFLNGLHVDWLDPVMTFISGKITWAPFYIVLLFLVIKNYKKQSIIIIIGIILLIVCSDQVSSGIFKPIFERPRPCHNEAIKDLVGLKQPPLYNSKMFQWERTTFYLCIFGSRCVIRE